MRTTLFAALAFIATQAFAVEPYTCRNGLFPSYVDIQSAEISTTLRNRVHFRADTQNCPDNDSCQEKAYLVDGNKILIAQNTEQWVCAWYFGKRREFVGWLPKNVIKPMPGKTPAIHDWVGTWKPIGGINEIKIAHLKNGMLSISGSALWQGGKNNYGYDIIHTGELNGEAIPIGNKISLGNMQEQYECVADMQLVLDNLVVSDNGNCGGVNVRFNDVYRKHP